MQQVCGLETMNATVLHSAPVHAQEYMQVNMNRKLMMLKRRIMLKWAGFLLLNF